MRIRTAVAALSLAVAGLLPSAGVVQADDWHMEVVTQTSQGPGNWSNGTSAEISSDDSRGLCLSDLYC
ncbi:hypothetical protein ACFC26_32980 [Kitasatospora purpeofusca]|uniref:hypothetical protein n=1 Tax=Kitasatospora purpeofusca TaxID=67352 RepID=UPI0035D6A89F